jgi:hypothetical protein
LAQRGARYILRSQFSILKREEERFYFCLKMESGELRTENVD